MREEIMDQGLRCLVPPELNNPEHFAEVDEFLRKQRDGEVVRKVVPRMTKDGLIFDAEITSSAIFDASGSVVGYAAVVRDVTEVRRVDEENQEVVANLRRLNESKNEFLAVVAHDLRTPLAVISGFAETLKESWKEIDTEQRVELLGRIAVNARDLAERVEQDLQVATSEAGMMRYTKAPFDLAALIELTVLELGGVTPGSRFSINVPDDLPLASGDVNRQKQILVNLLSNAIKFSPQDSPIEINAKRVGDMLEVTITDRGVGIDASDLGSVFEKFTQLVQPSGSTAKGAGLGLYISKSMVEAQGGTMRAASERGKGSAFSYTIPIAN
jgi:two-component system, cell cycle sensor histidine kinase DivJ